MTTGRIVIMSVDGETLAEFDKPRSGILDLRGSNLNGVTLSAEGENITGLCVRLNGATVSELTVEARGADVEGALLDLRNAQAHDLTLDVRGAEVVGASVVDDEELPTQV